MEINGETKNYIILGNPIAHTLSPAMYNTAFRSLNLNCIYTACQIEPENLGEAVNGLKALGIQGGNVTIPFKEKIIPFLDGVSQESQLIGAVNTLYRKNGELWGTNTDGIGFIRALQSRNFAVQDSPGAVILGAGGAAKAVAVALVVAGMKKLCIINRSKERGTVLAEKIRELGGEAVFREWNDVNIKAALQEYSLLINTTPLGMVPHIEKGPQIDQKWFTPQHFFVDLIYNPRETQLLSKAKAQGCKIMGGLDMLLEQGVVAFEHWFKEKVPREAMVRELERWFA